jgi:hypothetical protein
MTGADSRMLSGVGNGSFQSETGRVKTRMRPTIRTPARTAQIMAVVLPSGGGGTLSSSSPEEG